MSAGLIETVYERFHAFASSFLGQGEDDFIYALKIRHTAAVAELAAAICHGENLPPDIAAAARLGAVLHDVGRFPQYRQYRSFVDRNTANHALLSVRHLTREGMLADVPGRIRRLAVGAVFLHNVRELPANLPPDLLTTVRVVRDADKIDIVRIMVNHFSNPNPEHTEVSLAAKPSPDRYTQSVYDAALARRMGDYRQIEWHNDFKLMILGWLYDFNSPSSLRLLRDQGHYQRIFELLPDIPPMRALRDQLLADLAQRLEGA